MQRIETIIEINQICNKISQMQHQKLTRSKALGSYSVAQANKRVKSS